MTSDVLNLSQDPGVGKTIGLKIGAALTSSIGREHVLETALADLIDNSVGHGASIINIRFQELKGRVTRIRIRDDGSGMDSVALHQAMEMSPDKRENKPHPFSMFGQGLKSSSMSQARVLSVYSSPAARSHVGSRMIREDAGGKLEYGELLPDEARKGFIGYDNENTTGTVIEWSSLDNVSHSGRQAERHRWLSETIVRISNHLGLVFHRFLEAEKIRISIDVLAEESGRPGAPTIVRAINPFSFEGTGHEHFPLTIQKALPKLGRIALECHIIPAHSRSESARIMGQDRSNWQGLYVYWRDRLVHFADWAGLATAKKEYALARVRLELSDGLRDVVTMNPAKKGVVLKPLFANAVSQATDSDGRYTFDQFLKVAGEQLKSSNRRVARTDPLTRVGSGLPNEVVEKIGQTLGWRDAQHSIDVDWAFVPEGQLFKVDLDNRRILLNSRYRVFLSATEENRHEDAPIVRTLLFLLMETFFKGGYLQQKTKDQIAAFQEILAAATEVQLREIAAHEESAMSDRAEKLSNEDFDPTALSRSRAFKADLEPDSPPRKTLDTMQIDFPNRTSPRAAPPPLINSVKKVRLPLPARRQETPEKLPATTALAIATHYRKGKTIGELALEHQVSDRAVALSLAESAFGPTALEDDPATAFRHGEAWAPYEREKLHALEKIGSPIEAMAAHLGRTAFAVAWKLLDRPKGVDIPNNRLLELRRNLAGEN